MGRAHSVAPVDDEAILALFLQSHGPRRLDGCHPFIIGKGPLGPEKSKERIKFVAAYSNVM
jgi:hypothetical protein